MKCCDFCGKERKDVKFEELHGRISRDELIVSNRFRECKIDTMDMLSKKMTYNWLNLNHSGLNICTYCVNTAKRFSMESITKARKSCHKFKSKQILGPSMTKGVYGEHANDTYIRYGSWGGHNVGCKLHFASREKADEFNSAMQHSYDIQGGTFALKCDVFRNMRRHALDLDDVLSEYNRQARVEAREATDYAYSFVRRKVKVTKLAHDTSMIRFMDNSVSKLKKAMKLREKEAA